MEISSNRSDNNETYSNRDLTSTDEADGDSRQEGTEDKDKYLSETERDSGELHIATGASFTRKTERESSKPLHRSAQQSRGVHIW